MPIFPETLLAEVRNALDAEAVLRHINYRPEMIQDTGNAIKCFCPIHRETIFRTLLVDKVHGTYRCTNYACSGATGGDLIDLYAQARGQGYEQALLELANIFGVSVDLTAVDQYISNTLEVARNYVQLGALVEAEEQFSGILRFKPDALPALEGLVRVYELTDRPAEFQAARLRLARALAAAGQPEPALELLAVYVRDNSTDHDARRFYIEVLKAAGHTEHAAGEYLNLADDLAGSGEIDQALALYRAAQALPDAGLDVSPHIIQLLVGAGRREEAIAENLLTYERYREAGQIPEAFAALQSTLELEPLNEELILRQAELVAAEALGSEALAQVCAGLERLLAARAHGTVGRALDTLEAAYPNRSRLMTLRADLEEARGNLERALDLRLLCVDLHQQHREFESALAVLEKTMQGRPANVALLSRKATLLRDLGQPEQAIPVYLELVDLFRGADEYEHAAAVYQTIIDLDPDELAHREAQFDLYLQLGMEPVIVQKALALAEAYAARDALNQALQLLNRAVGTVPHSSELLTRHAEIFEQAGRRGEAAEQYLAVGKLLLDQNQFDRARLMLERALKCVPEHLEAREGLADVQAAQDFTLQAMSTYTDLVEFYQRENQPEAVIRLALKILKIQPEHLPTLLNLARGYGRAGRVDQQLAAQTRLVQLYLQGQSYTRATELCEEILQANEDYTPALEQLVAIAESTRLGSQSVKYLWKLSQVHARAGRRDQEQDILQQIILKDPLHTAAWFRHLELLMLWATPRALGAAISQFTQHFSHAGRAPEAIQVLEDLRQTANPKPEIFAGLARLYREQGDSEGLKAALRTQGELLGKLLRDPEALVVWAQLAELEPENASIRRTRIEIMLRNAMAAEVQSEYRALAEALLRQGRLEEAEVTLREVLEHNPRDRTTREQLITMLIQAGETARAAEQIEEAAGRMLEEGQPAQAIDLLLRTFEFDPERDAVFRKIIAIRQRMGDVEGALADYARLLDLFERRQAQPEFEQTAHEALKLDPRHEATRLRLAEFYLANQRPNEAEPMLLGLAAQRMAAQDFSAADRLIARVLEFDPESLSARAQRAELMAKRGQTNEALSEFISLAGAMGQTPRGGNSAEAALAAYRSGNYEGIELIKEYTFDTYVVGARNNFAHASALAVSRAPARNYNPLFLYSDVGLGKTHLCHAIAHYIRDRQPEFRLLYTTTEEFVAELIEAIQTNQIATFRARHKLVDVLLIDDVQFLSGKERAQEEFFNIFNTIFQAGKQVVLTSDRPPKDIAHLEKRLKSRFGAGIIVDIQPPDLETRIAILRQELVARGREGVLDDEVILFIAEHVDSNIRELKGALNQAVARQDMSGTRITPNQLGEILARNYTEA
jgi:chromosomal replication initiator protein DnaA